ncbi:MAG TPA: hypothetical protein VLL97_12385, partial [Acidobacteriota bacterium]|nr:hypothetical protein [Acidobacteriota bacterium]
RPKACDINVNIFFARAITIAVPAVLPSAVMKIQIYSNGKEAHLTHFIGNFLANVCFGIASSLKTPRPIRRFRFDIEEESVRLEVNDAPVPINLSKGFSRIIILDTIRGMVRHLKIEDPAGTLRVVVDLEGDGFSFEMDRRAPPEKADPRPESGPGASGG